MHIGSEGQMSNTALEQTRSSVRQNHAMRQSKDELSPSVERAISLVASGMAQKDAAAEAGIRADYLSRMINSERGQQRLSHWLRREVTRLAPAAVRSLGSILDGKNATAAVRAAETILDRSGLHTDDLRQHIKFETGDLNVYFDILPKSTN